MNVINFHLFSNGKQNVVYSYITMLLSNKNNALSGLAKIQVCFENILSERGQKGHVLHDYNFMKFPADLI